MQQDTDRRGDEPPEPPSAEVALPIAEPEQYVVVATHASKNHIETVNKIYRYACGVCRGRNADFQREVASSAAVKVWSANHQVSLRSFNGYLYSIVRNTCIDLTRQEINQRRLKAASCHEFFTTRATHDADRVPDADARTARIVAEIRRRMGDLQPIFDLRMKGLEWHHIAMHLEPTPQSKTAVRNKAKALAKRYQRRFQIASAEVAAMFALYDA